MPPYVNLKFYLLRSISENLSEMFTSDIKYLFIIRIGTYVKNARNVKTVMPLFRLKATFYQQSDGKVEHAVVLTALVYIFSIFYFSGPKLILTQQDSSDNIFLFINDISSLFVYNCYIVT